MPRKKRKQTSRTQSGESVGTFYPTDSISAGVPATLGTPRPGQTTQQMGSARGGILLATEQSITFSGPLPDPMTLAAYRDIDPALPNRIMAMAEKEQDAVIQDQRTVFDLEKQKQADETNLARSAQRNTLIVAIALIAASVVLVLSGYGNYAIGSLVTALVPGGISFVTHRKNEQKQAAQTTKGTVTSPQSAKK